MKIDLTKIEVLKIEEIKTVMIEKAWHNTTIYKCIMCGCEQLQESFNFCPNCGRKVVKA